MTPQNAFTRRPKRGRLPLGVVFGLGRQASRFARWLGCLSAPLFRPFRLPLLPLLGERTQLLLSRCNLRSRLLTPAGQGFEVLARGGQLGLHLGQIPSRLLEYVGLMRALRSETLLAAGHGLWRIGDHVATSAHIIGQLVPR